MAVIIGYLIIAGIMFAILGTIEVYTVLLSIIPGTIDIVELIMICIFWPVFIWYIIKSLFEGSCK